MELTIPRYAKTMTETLKAHRSPHAAPATAPRAAQPERRSLGRFFRRETPSTFHRCLAVHIHYAQRASAFD
ncbi:MAG TPA: hypothetical protein VEI03_10505 [Stellaceae bacterium]|nr:hypothetical protein [Stellaceae bacterium]